MSRNYIGLACTWHDPALAIVDARGEVLFAEAAERYLQKKRAHHAAPDDIVRVSELIDEHCEPDADLVVARTWSDRSVTANRWFQRSLGVVDAVMRLGGRRARGGPPPAGGAELGFAKHPGVNFMRYGLEAHRGAVTQASSALWRGLQWSAVADYVARSRAAGRAGPRPPEELAVPGRRVYRVGIDHHQTHAAAACFTSPFDEAVCAIVDGYAELGSTGFFHYANGRFTPIEKRQRSWPSIGLLYNLLCTACGFDPIQGEEWKVMGLAPYGRFDADAYALLEPALRVEDLHFVAEDSPRQYGAFLGELASFPAADLAATAQEFFQRRMDELLGNLAARGLSRNLVLGGGCALNSAANGKYLDRTSFERLHVFSAPGDDGNALGAALLAYRGDHPDWRPPATTASPYLGSVASEESVESMVRLGRPPGHRSWPGKVHERTAELLAEGKIVGWFQGRAEFGPRALGNRSILADPRDPAIKDVLNERVKFREEFRPFAPSILHEHGDEYFEGYQESPYMERTLRFRDAVKDKVPGVVHVDGTGRLQTVKREWNERYYDLIRAFRDLTGVPVLLNTSFNVMGKPIVHSVEDAVAVFYTSGLDVLVIGDEIVEK